MFLFSLLHKLHSILYRYVTSWIETRTQLLEKSNIIMLFDKYIPICLENVRTRFKKITPITETSHIEMLCHLLDCLLTPNNTPPDCPKEWYELYFVFSCVWAFGSAMFQEQVSSYSFIKKKFEYNRRRKKERN